MNDIQALVIPSFLLTVPLSQDENCDWKKMIIINVSELLMLSRVGERRDETTVPAWDTAGILGSDFIELESKALAKILKP